MLKENKFSKLINGLRFQLLDKSQLVSALEFYADTNKVSKKYFDNIFMLYSIRDEFLKGEIIKRVSQKTILGALSK